MSHLAIAAACLLAAVFGVSAGTKLSSRRALRAFATSLVDLRLTSSRRSRPLALAAAGAEAATAGLLLVPGTRPAGLAAAAALAVTLTAGVARVLARGAGAPCRCFGASSVPLSGRHLVRNIGLVLTAAAGLAAAHTSPGVPSTASALLAGGAGALAGLLVTLLDDVVELFAPSSRPGRGSDDAARRGGGPGRTAGRRQPAAHGRSRPPAS